MDLGDNGGAGDENPAQPRVQGPWYSVYDPNNGFVYVTDQNTATVTVISGSAAIGVVRVGTDPYFATVDSGNGNVYVMNAGSANVSVINSMSVVGSLIVGSGPGAATYDSGNGHVYVANLNSADVSVIEFSVSTSTSSGLPLTVVVALLAVPLATVGVAIWLRRKRYFS